MSHFQIIFRLIGRSPEGASETQMEDMYVDVGTDSISLTPSPEI